VLGVAVDLALVVHDHVEVAFEEGGRSWRICHIGLARSLAGPGASVVVVFSVEVVHDRVLSVDELIDVGHEVANGVCVSLVDLLEQVDVGDSLFVVRDDIFVFHACKGVAVLEVLVSVLTESFITSLPYSSEVVSIARTIVSRLVVGHEEARQGRPRGDALCWEVVEPQECYLAHYEREVSHHVIFVAAGSMSYNVVHLKPYTRVGVAIVFLDSCLEVLGVSDRPEMS
jgi:hypothetical protein